VRICLSSSVSHFCFRGITCVDRELNSVLWRRFPDLGATSFSSDVWFCKTDSDASDTGGCAGGLAATSFGSTRIAAEATGKDSAIPPQEPRPDESSVVMA